MTHKTIHKILVAAGLCLAVAMPAMADINALQCNMLRDGKYVPGLRIDFGDRTVEVVLGERGLTTRNLYRADKIEAYVQQAFVTGDEEITCVLNCGLLPDDPEQVQLVPPPQPPPRPVGN